MTLVMNRKARRAEIPEFILHTKSFIKEKDAIKEVVLDDGSVKFSIEGFASTEVQDGSGDIIKVDGIDTTRYEINPVLQKGHKRGSENTIGRVTKIEKVMGKGLYIYADVILNPEIAHHKEIIHGLRHGLISGFSIGFKEVQSKYDETLKSNVIEKLELYEISLVDIPDNPLTVRKFIDTVMSKSVDKTIPEDDMEEILEAIDEPVVEEPITESEVSVDETKEDEVAEVVAEVVEEVVAEVVEGVEAENDAGTEVVETINAEVDVTTEGENTTVTNAEVVTEEVISEETPQEEPEVESEVVVDEEKPEVDEIIEENINEEVVPSSISNNIIIPEVIETDLGKSADVEIKALQISEIAEGDFVLFRTVWEDERGIAYVSPKLEYKARIGYIFKIMTEGSAITRGEVEQASVEEPLIFILIYEEVNGMLIPTRMTNVCCFDEVLIESKYEGESKAVFIPTKKELGTIHNSISNDNGNVIESKSVEETEKDSGNAIKIKELEKDNQEMEKMLNDMIIANQKLIESDNEKALIIEKVRKTKSTVGIVFQGGEQLPNSKIGGIVQMMKNN